MENALPSLFSEEKESIRGGRSPRSYVNIIYPNIYIILNPRALTHSHLENPPWMLYATFPHFPFTASGKSHLSLSFSLANLYTNQQNHPLCPCLMWWVICSCMCYVVSHYPGWDFLSFFPYKHSLGPFLVYTFPYTKIFNWIWTLKGPHFPFYFLTKKKKKKKKVYMTFYRTKSPFFVFAPLFNFDVLKYKVKI